MRLEVVDHAGGDAPQTFDDAGAATTHAFARAKRLAKALGIPLEVGRYRGGILLMGWDKESAEEIPLVWLGPPAAASPEPPGQGCEGSGAG